MDISLYMICNFCIIYPHFLHIEDRQNSPVFSQFSCKFLQHFWGNRFTCMVKSVLFYGSEYWKLRKDLTRKLRVFVNRCLQTIFKIRLPRIVSNNKLREMSGQEDIIVTLLNRLYGVWQHDCLPDTFVFKNTCNRKKFVRVSRWISGFDITKKLWGMSLNPLLPAKHSRGTGISLPSCMDVSAWIFS